jgi:F0F1-type ATP synthase assembly protein I
MGKEVIMQDIITQSLAVSMVVKIIIDITKYNNLQSAINGAVWAVVAIFVGVSVAFLFHANNNGEFNTATVSRQILVGIMAAGQAIGVTELQKKANR